MARILALILAFGLLLGPADGVAQQIQRIAAIVNDDVVSLFDLQSRIRLVIVSSRLPDRPEVRRRIAPQVLRSLIDERLQLQEAKQRNVSVTERDMGRAIADIERQNGVPKGGFERFLLKNGIESQTVLDQLRANIAWSKLVGRRLRPSITVGEDEVDEAITRLKANRGKMEYRLAEIYLQVDNPDDESEVRGTARRLVEQIRKGARFDALARQFSQSATAAVGGDMGWIPETELDEELRQVISGMPGDGVADPIRTVTGFRIVRLLERRRIAAPDPAQIKVGLKQIFLPVPQNAPAEDVKSQIDLVKTVGESITGCSDVEAVSKEVGSTRPPDLGKFALSDLSPLIRTAVDGLKVGETSKPVRLPEGLLMLMVCELDEPEVKLPDRTEIANLLTRRRLDMMARRYLRDIRSAAIVDIRV